MNVLIACECSQTVCNAFRKRRHNAFSCDIENEYGGHPEWHIKTDCIDVINGNCSFFTEDSKEHFVTRWDLIIAHPPCTYLCNCQAPLYNIERFGIEKVSERRRKQNEAISFFLSFTDLNTKVAIENPVGIMSRIYRKPDQTIQPYFFGDAATKRTCLWLFGLSPLKPTKMLDLTSLKKHKFPNSNSMGEWYYKTSCLPAKDRAKARSKTFEGIAEAMADQWGSFKGADK